MIAAIIKHLNICIFQSNVRRCPLEGRDRAVSFAMVGVRRLLRGRRDDYLKQGNEVLRQPATAATASLYPLGVATYLVGKVVTATAFRRSTDNGVEEIYQMDRLVHLDALGPAYSLQEREHNRNEDMGNKQGGLCLISSRGHSVQGQRNPDSLYRIRYSAVNEHFRSCPARSRISCLQLRHPRHRTALL